MNNKQVSILYAEDDEEDRFIFLEAVRGANKNIHIINVQNGQDVLNHLGKVESEHELPSAIVSDLQMPLCDGLDMLRAVRQEPRWSAIPVILFTTSSSRTDISTATKLGVQAYFTKPATYQEYIERVKEILEICKETSYSR